MPADRQWDTLGFLFVCRNISIAVNICLRNYKNVISLKGMSFR